MSGIELVLFDLGDVVCRFVPQRRLAALSAVSPRSAEEINQALWGSDFSDLSDAGALAAAEMCERICSALEVELPRAELARLWALAFEPNGAVLDMATAVRKKVPTGMLSNNPPLLLEGLAAHLPQVERAFEPIVFSCQHRARKPERKLYEAVVQDLGLAPGALLLIDDSQRNAEGARAAGWQAMHFQDPEGLRRDLGDSGLL